MLILTQQLPIIFSTIEVEPFFRVYDDNELIVRFVWDDWIRGVSWRRRDTGYVVCQVDVTAQHATSRLNDTLSNAVAATTGVCALIQVYLLSTL